MLKPLSVCFFLLVSCLPVWGEPIHQLVRDHKLEQVKELLQERLDEEGSSGVLALLESRQDGATPLLIACYKGQIDMVELLLSSGANIEAEDMLGDTPLFRSIAEYHENLAAYLLSKGASRAHANKLGETPFMIAARLAPPSLLKQMMVGKLELGPVDSKGRSALHHAVEGDVKDNVALLLAEGSDINAPDGKGSTVLQKAVAMGDASMVALLLDNGADPNLKDARGRDAYCIAVERRDAKIISVLDAHLHPEQSKPKKRKRK